MLFYIFFCLLLQYGHEKGLQNYLQSTKSLKKEEISISVRTVSELPETLPL